MNVRYFKFKSEKELSNAKRYVEKTYPDIAVLDNTTDLTLGVELRNSFLFDDIRIAPALKVMGGEIIGETPLKQD